MYYYFEPKKGKKTFLDLVTLTFELDLDTLTLDLHAEFQFRMFVLSSRREVTHTLTDTLTMSKHPLQMRGVTSLNYIIEAWYDNGKDLRDLF